MFRTPLVGLIAGLTLLTACSSSASAPPAPASASVSAPASASATSAPAPSAPASGAESVDDILARLVTAQATVKTYSIDMETRTEVSGKTVKMTMKGVIDQSDPAKLSMSMTTQFSGFKTRLIQVYGDLYVQMAATGKKWLKVPSSQAGQYETTTDVDFTESLENSRDSIQSVVVVGEETGLGTPTTHYRMTLTADALDELGGTPDGSLDGETFRYDVWLDGADLPRKFAMDLTMDVDSEKTPVMMTATMDDYNEPVTIEAPPKSQIVSFGG